MAVGFGTFGFHTYTTSPCQVAISGVTSGQPLIIALINFGFTTNPSATWSDTFSTSYSYTLIDSCSTSSGSTVWMGLFAATGGSGTSGTVSASFSGGPNSVAMGVVPLTGASILSGTSIVDVNGHVNNGTAGTTIGPLSLTPNGPNEGAVYAIQGASSGITLTGPTSPWANNSITFSSNTPALMSTYPSPTPGSALSTTWTAGSSEGWCAVGAIILPQAPLPIATSYLEQLELGRNVPMVMSTR